jgi:hypothetical protein
MDLQEILFNGHDSRKFFTRQDCSAIQFPYIPGKFLIEVRIPAFGVNGKNRGIRSVNN